MPKNNVYAYVGRIVTSITGSISPEDQRKYIIDYCNEKNIGIKNIIESKDEDLSNRTSVIDALDKIHEGDILIVHTIHSIGHTSRDIISIVKILMERKAQLHCILEGISELNSNSVFTLHMLGPMLDMIAEVYQKKDMKDIYKTTFDTSSYDFKCKAIMHNGNICNKHAKYRANRLCYCGTHIKKFSK